ncbi:MAG: AhpC/TSA family protein [Gammaproteobacteria bacterium]|nr:AhpC/TSA family protein [Gammaproteobacteria bacterium]
MSSLKPRQKVPDLEVQTVAGSSWKLSDRKPTNLTMIVAYRGLHCPICKPYLSDLNRHIQELSDLGVDVLAVSTDDQSRAGRAKQEWGLDRVSVGYGMGIEAAREWGLYISNGKGATSSGIEEPQQFSEPGLFLVKPDQTLYASSVNTMPFARPHFKDLVGAIGFIVKNDYPARGEA